jgi:cyclophilin family peptidyl-prolyl cis-trans isomerase
MIPLSKLFSLLFFTLLVSCLPLKKTGPENNRPSLERYLQTDKSGLTFSYATLKTVHGVLTIRFFSKKAPKSVKRILHLIQKGFYDGLSFHRAIKNFIIQTGDPTNKGNGGSGVKLKQEFNNTPHIKGTIALAKGQNPNSADSQFYIALSTLPHLDKKYTVIGQVTNGLDVLNKILEGDKIISLTFNSNPF